MKFTPMASDLINTSPGPGTGSGALDVIQHVGSARPWDFQLRTWFLHCRGEPGCFFTGLGQHAATFDGVMGRATFEYDQHSFGGMPVIRVAAAAISVARRVVSASGCPRAPSQ